MASPCVAKCKPENGLCTGCLRTINEIVGWVQLTDAQRDYKIKSVRRMISTHTCPGCQQPTQCDIAAGKETCWCFDLPKCDTPEPVTDTSQCYCRHCLTTMVNQE
uniref:cysteine-rich CWC family protein n=1 Tax=Thaumasiovibrio subtropicus TaxID=1891207 RepID=UPI000B34DF52|nr:cysteine-rich CWC family protein [Thaumasiovibrio subtropicus]